jgi:hypothetical protein
MVILYLPAEILPSGAAQRFCQIKKENRVSGMTQKVSFREHGFYSGFDMPAEK